MYLEILVLASLAREPAHGYGLKKRIFQELAGAVEVNSNTLYPALRRFSTDGLVRSEEQHEPGQPPRQVYRLTSAGWDRLKTLLSEFEPAAARRTEEFWTRVAFFDLVTAEVRQRVLRARLDALDTLYQQLDELRTRTVDLQSQPASWPTQTLDFRLEMVVAERRWVESRLS